MRILRYFIQTKTMIVEKANRIDHKELTVLTIKSKSYWGYSPDQIEKWNDELTITQEYVDKNDVFKLSDNGQIIGYYSYLRLNSNTVKLDNIFIHPEYIRKGSGNLLMGNFIERMKKNGCKKITLDSEPNAEVFYKNFDFTVVGKLESSIKDRFLPIMEKEI